MGYTPKNFTRNVVKIVKTITIRPQEDPYRRQFIKFINTLKCPICQSDLDGSITEQANLYCRLDPEEYNVQYTQGSTIPNGDCIRLKCPFGNSYKIDHKQMPDGKFMTNVWIMVEEGFSLPHHKTIIQHFGEMLFGADTFNKEEFLKKMELYDVFS